MGRPARLSSQRVDTRALVLRRSQTGDADLLITLFTEELGVVTAAARAARRPTSKLGALEPIHTLRVGLEVQTGRDIVKLAEAKLDRPRAALLEDGERLASAFEVLVWVRGAMPPHQTDRAAFFEVERALDAFDDRALNERVVLATVGVRLLACMGYALELEACVLSGRPCPPDSPAYVRPSAGGVVSRQLGGGAAGDILVRASARRAARDFIEGRFDLDSSTALTIVDADALIQVVDAAFASHREPRRSERGQPRRSSRRDQ